MEITPGDSAPANRDPKVCPAPRTIVSMLVDISIRFFHYYRVTAYPFNPILADMDRFESDLCTYLSAYAAGELRNPEKISDRWAPDKSIGHVSLLLATLAAGCHYSDVEYPQRFELTTDFGTGLLQPTLNFC